MYNDRRMEDNRSEDLESECVRIFDVNPMKRWPLPTSNVVVGGRPFIRMPFVNDDIQRALYKKDGESPVMWYISFGSVRDQKNVLLYEVLPFLMEMNAAGGEILWSPCPDEVEGVDFRQDCLEVIDAFERIEEWNARYKTNYWMGLAKMWLPRGDKFEEQRVYHCRLNACLDMVGYYYAQCRVLSLGNFTTSEHRQRGVTVDVDDHGNRMFVAEEYLEESGYKLTDYCLRTVRQRLRKLFAEEGVEPEDWLESKLKGLIRAPGFKRKNDFRFYDAPRGAPFKDLIKE